MDTLLSAHEKTPAVTPLLDAWSIVDSSHRLAKLFGNASWFAKKQHMPSWRAFKDRAKAVEELRHAVQHIDERIPKSDDPLFPVSGVLTWFVANTDRQGGKSCMLMPGRTTGGTRFFINPLGIKLYLPVGPIVLTLENVTVNLSELVECVGTLAKDIEGSWAAGMPPGPTLAADVWTGVELAFGKAGEPE